DNYIRLGKPSAAEPLAKRAAAIVEAKVGSSSPLLAGVLDTLSESYESQLKYSEAEATRRKELAIWGAAPAQFEPMRRATIERLADVLTSLAKSKSGTGSSIAAAQLRQQEKGAMSDKREASPLERLRLALSIKESSSLPENKGLEQLESQLR